MDETRNDIEVMRQELKEVRMEQLRQEKDKDKLLEGIIALNQTFHRAMMLSKQLSERIQEKMQELQQRKRKLKEAQMEVIHNYSRAVGDNVAMIAEMIQELRENWAICLNLLITVDNQIDSETLYGYMRKQIKLVFLAMENLMYKRTILVSVETELT